VCAYCQIPFGSKTYKERDDKAYCEVHYQQLFGKTCDTCKQPISGEIINVFGKSYHPNHFCCAGCKAHLGGKYFGHNQTPLCENCFRTIPNSERKKAEEEEAKAKKRAEKARKEEEKKAKLEKKQLEEARKKKQKELLQKK